MHTLIPTCILFHVYSDSNRAQLHTYDHIIQEKKVDVIANLSGVDCHCRHPLRASSPATAGTKSAKRRAAEALLAAQYGGLSSSSLGNTGLKRHSSVLQQHAGLSTDASAAAQQQEHSMPSSKRHQSMLNAAINRLGGQPAAVTADSPQEPAAAAAAPFGAQAAANSQQPRDVLQQMQLPQQQQQQQVDASGSSWQPSHTAHEAAAHLASADNTAGGRAATGGHVMSVEAAGAAKQQGQQHQAAVVVPACGSHCQHTLTQRWCHSQVGLSSFDASVLSVVLFQRPLTHAQNRCLTAHTRVFHVWHEHRAQFYLSHPQEHKLCWCAEATAC